MSLPGAARVLLLSLLAGTLFSGCAWRTADTTHHFGPVVFRFSPPRASAGGVSDLVHVGPLVEAGAQWGVSLGVMERITVVPATAGSPASPSRAEPPLRWPAFGALEPERWHVSLLYVRIPTPSAPALILRRLYGAELTIGAETRSASLGWTSRLLVHLPEDAVSVARFDGQRPMTSVFVSWPAGTLDAVAARKTFEEGTP